MFFYLCSNLFEVVVPDNTTSIGPEAFGGCRSLTLLTLGKGLDEVGDEAFAGCYRLAVVEARGNIPASLGTDVWPYHSMALLVPDGALEAYQNISGWNKFSHIETGKEMKAFYAIDGDIFYYSIEEGQVMAQAVNCDCQTAEIREMITIGDKPCMVTHIPNMSFYGCENLRHVVIPNSVVSIGAYAFGACYTLSTIL